MCDVPSPISFLVDPLFLSRLVHTGIVCGLMFAWFDASGGNEGLMVPGKEGGTD